MNSGSSAPMGCGSQLSAAAARSSSYQASRPACMATLPPVRRTTITSVTSGQCLRASSTLAFRGTALPARMPSSAVTTILESQSWMRLARLSGEKPPNTTEWTAPMRAQASMA